MIPQLRYHWLIKQIQEKEFEVGAEIGCANGTTTKRLLQYCPRVHIFAVDKWEKVERPPDVQDRDSGDERYVGCYNWDPEKGFQRFRLGTSPYKSRLRILKGDSVLMADKVNDNSLDFIFIDADHSYQGVLRDLAAWVPKLKSEGLLSGHDIHLAGVVRAVREKIPNYQEAGVDHVWFAKKEDYVD